MALETITKVRGITGNRRAAELEDPRPKAHRPYPMQYVWDLAMKDGSVMTIRPIHPEDEPLMVKFHETLSARSVYFRYFASLSLKTRVAHERLVRICFGDYDHDLALVAEIQGPAGPQIIGVGRINRLHPTDEAEVAILVTDAYQKHGVGEELLRRTVRVAREEGIHALSAEMRPDNLAMQVIAKRFGFRLKMQRDFASLRARLEL